MAKSLIIYVGENEIFVCRPEARIRLEKEYFDGTGRRFEDFDIQEMDDIIEITAAMRYSSSDGQEEMLSPLDSTS